MGNEENGNGVKGTDRREINRKEGVKRIKESRERGEETTRERREEDK